MLRFFTLYLVLLAKAATAQPATGSVYVDNFSIQIPGSETKTTSDIARFIMQHYTSENERIRAAYSWVTANIRYDKDSIHRVILDENREEKVTYALARRKGVCENFAAIFTDICVKSGIRSFVVEGLTKENGMLQKSPHAWCAVFTNNDWFLFDPTWDASGRMNYYMIRPEEFIETHIPYDPLFQFSKYPVSFNRLHKSSFGTDNPFDYKDSINSYESSDSLSRYLSAISRIEKNGWPAALIDTKLKQLRLEVELIFQDSDTGGYNSAAEMYNSAIAVFNSFLIYRNNRFQPPKGKEEVQGIFRSIDEKITAAKKILAQIKNSKAALQMDTGDIGKKLDDLAAKAKEQKDFWEKNGI